MALVDLRVELSAYSHSFQIQVPQHSTVLNVKQEIRVKCPGAPREDGQRLIWRGRFLRDDEKVIEIWTSSDDTRIVHLAVHPSAWTSEPPSQSSSQPTPAPYPTQRHVPQQQHNYTPSPPAATPLSLIVNKHTTAIHVLTHGRLPPAASSDPVQQTALRQYTTSIIQSFGWSWPAILDADYPPPNDSPDGLRYERVILDNHPYLKLVTPNALPSPCQMHALKVLSHTFALLAIPSPDPVSFPRLTPVPYTPPNTNLNNHLQQLGLPPLRLAPNQNANQNPNDPNNPLAPEIRAIPLRALMVPLMMLTFRTMLLMYFFSPSKRPLFGVILSAWILYEAWGAFRAVLGNGDQAARAGGVARQDNGQAQAQNGQRGPPPAGTSHGSLGRSQVDTILDRISNLNLSSEEAILDTEHAHPEPSLFHRAKTFVGLLFMTLHPAVWDRRRNVLRRREGRIRTEANTRESQPTQGDNGEEDPRAHVRAQLVARHQQRPRWVREYIDRVQISEWVDDA